MNSIRNFMKNQKKLLIFFVTILIASILPLVIQTKPARCAFVVIIMSVFWLTNALPIGITSLIPVVCFPLLGILPSDKVSEGYFKDIIMLFFGGSVVAQAIEITRLHERIALKVLLKFGSKPKWLMLGFMLVTAFLSLWISNTAVYLLIFLTYSIRFQILDLATSMMMPIILASCFGLIKHDPTYHDELDIKNFVKSNETIDTIIHSTMTVNGDKNDKISNEINSHKMTDEEIKNIKNPKAKNLITGFLLCSAYSATIGGLGSLVGTAPNVVLKGYFDTNHSDLELNFLTFMLFAMPISIIMIILSWLWLSFRWLPKEDNWFSFKRNKNEKLNENLEDMLHQRYEELGPMNWAQKCVGSIFVLLITMWITRDLHNKHIPGWAFLFKKKFVTDTTPAMIAVLLIFICPKENIFKGCPYNHLLDWKQVQKLFPWNIILLLGGGLVMASGFQSSGLSLWIGAQLKFLAFGNKELILVFIILISATSTEFTSNVSIASIFIPLVDTLAQELKISPAYLLIPLTLSVSLAFMLPVATPNNAIIFSTGHLKVRDMISTGIVMNLIGFLVIFAGSNLWLPSIFNISSHSKFSNSTVFNSTTPI